VADYREAFVGIDVAKLRNAIAIADAGREGEVRFFGEVDASATNMRRVLGRIANRFDRVHFCYEAGPTGYGLYRLIRSLGHQCTVVAPSLIPRKPGDRVKTNRRDAVSLARLLRAGELTAVWVPDEGHEAMRDLVRARSAAVETLRIHRQQVSAFMLKHGRTYPRKKGWTMRYLRWLQEQQFDHIRSRYKKWSKQFASPGTGSTGSSARSKSSSRPGLWSRSCGRFKHCAASIWSSR
jgi:transposase